MSSDRGLTGDWDGIFNYPHSLPATSFAATLREEGGSLSGETVERGGDRAPLHALLQGSRAGASVAFVKIYDNGHQTPIDYAGTLNGDATEITGRWTIANEWSGTFIMVRRPDKEAPVETRVAQTVER
ncbi:MAG TPA: hypothetical protein VM657_03145 [Sphingomonas sp.]|nr:hypothetical protein [Sphingomonas sp.]